MTENRSAACKFTHRLADTLTGDESEPKVYVCDDTHYELADDGRLVSTGSGAEAVLIVRGPEEGRLTAVERLLALLAR